LLAFELAAFSATARILRSLIVEIFDFLLKRSIRAHFLHHFVCAYFQLGLLLLDAVNILIHFLELLFDSAQRLVRLVHHRNHFEGVQAQQPTIKIEPHDTLQTLIANEFNPVFASTAFLTVLPSAVLPDGLQYS